MNLNIFKKMQWSIAVRKISVSTVTWYSYNLFLTSHINLFSSKNPKLYKQAQANGHSRNYA